jgi:Ca2+-binding EF-hand superfamily protein
MNDLFSNVKSKRRVSDEDVKKFALAADKNSDGKVSKKELLAIFKLCSVAQEKK